MARHRNRFLADALHQTAIAQDASPVLADVVAELGVQDALGEREAHRVRDTLSERAGRRFDAVGVLVFGMAGGLAVDLTEMFEVLERDRHLAEAFVFRVDRAHSRQVKQGIEQGRSVAIGKHKPVTIRPDGIFGVVAQKLLP